MTTIVRTLLVLYAVAGLFCFCLLWNYASATDAGKNAAIVMASMLPVLISVLPYLTIPKLERHFRYGLIVDSKAGEFVSGEIPSAYFAAYGSYFSNLNKAEPQDSPLSWSSVMKSGHGMNIVERGLIEDLATRFTFHWDLEPKTRNNGPIGTMYFWKAGSAKEKTVITQDELIKNFPWNPLIQNPEVFVGGSWTLPPNSRLSATETDKARIIKIQSDVMTTTISITHHGGGVIQNDLPGVFESDPMDMNRYGAVQYTVDLIGEFTWKSRFLNRTDQQKRWFDNIAEELSRFDWDAVEEESQKIRMKEAVERLLQK